MVVYSPIAATYGSRIEQFLETDADYEKYHDKINNKLRHLRHRCQLITKDTRKYTAKEKYSKITSDDYDKKNKLFGALVLMHTERDLSFAESIKLRIRRRGKAKGNEQRLMATRLKKAYKTSQNLVEITKNEKQWITRAQYLAYAKIVHAEYLLFGKQVKTKNNAAITGDLAVALAACAFLRDLQILPADIIDLLNTRYEYTLSQYGSNMNGASDIRSFVNQTIEAAKESNEELAVLLFNNKYTVKIEDVDMDASPVENNINWRSFRCIIRDNQLAQLISDVNAYQIKDIADYSTKLAKWEAILNKQEERVSHVSTNDIDEDGDEDVNTEENEQILLAYIKFQKIFTSICRDVFLFNRLWKQWENLGSSMSSKLTKYKEIERMVKNINNYLKEVTELPGVYSDDDLVAQLELTILYFQLYLNAGCLASLYQTKGQYRESLALYVDSNEKLHQKIQIISGADTIALPEDVITEKKVETLQNLIQTGWKSVIALAEYETELNKSAVVQKYRASVIEKIDSLSVRPNDVHLDNLFPLRPVIKPTGAKPTLFDLAFNYIDYEEKTPVKSQEPITQQESVVSESQDVANEQPAKKRGFLGGLFGR